MSIVETVFGSIEARPKMEYYPSGVIRACSPQKESPLKTAYGVFIPQYCGDELRKRQTPYLTYHENGMINVLPLQEQAEVEIPQGRIPVEKVTFYPDGKLKRLFPLDGCLSGYWGEEDERGLARPIKLKTPAGELEALIISIYLSPEGEIRSLTFWPGETVKISTPVGELSVKTGISYYDSGQLKSVEPENPVSVETSVGKILAYDPDAIGITGDRNSIKFSEAGELISLKTVSNMFVVKEDTGDIKRVEPPLKYSPLDGETLEPSPLTVTFMEGFVCLSAEKMQDVVARTENVTARRYAQLFAM